MLVSLELITNIRDLERPFRGLQGLRELLPDGTEVEPTEGGLSVNGQLLTYPFYNDAVFITALYPNGLTDQGEEGGGNKLE